jgi:hypothetical protein
MRPWRYPGPSPDGWWCVPPNCYQNLDPSLTIDTEMALVHDLGVVDLRLEFPWYLIEPTRGGYDWSRADEIVAAADAQGVSLDLVLVFSPRWAASSPSTAPAASDYAAFVTAVAQRYHADLLRPQAALEMWNEPDQSHYWTSGESAYISSVLSPGYRAAKGVDRRIAVEMGGPLGDSQSCCSWLDGLLAASAPFDIAAFHDYSGTDVSTASSYRSDLSAHGRSVPIWDGEYGVQQQGSDDSSQATAFTHVLTSPSDIAVAQWYNLRDDFSMTCCPMAVAVTGHWGLVEHDDCTRKQGYAAMAQLLHAPAATPPPCPGTGATDSARAEAAAKGGDGRAWIPALLAGVLLALAGAAAAALRRRGLLPRLRR